MVEKFVNKNLYKLELYSAKVVPMLMAGITLANTILGYYNVDAPILSYIGGVSILVVIRFYITSYLSFTGEVKAFTLTSFNLGISVVGFNYHRNIKDYINSIVHEAEHVKQHMLEAYCVADKDEPPAYTIGFLASKMMMFFLKMLQK